LGSSYGARSNEVNVLFRRFFLKIKNTVGRSTSLSKRIKRTPLGVPLKMLGSSYGARINEGNGLFRRFFLKIKNTVGRSTSLSRREIRTPLGVPQ
jgi:hypothetical protein